MSPTTLFEMQWVGQELTVEKSTCLGLRRGPRPIPLHCFWSVI